MSQISTSTSAISDIKNSKKEEQIPSLWDALSSDDGTYAKLFQQLPDNYFNQLPDDVLQQQPSNIKQLLDKYENLPVKPFIRKKNLNADDESAPTKNSWEIGLSFDF